MSRKPSSPFALDAVEEFLRTKGAREKKTVAAYHALLHGTERGTKPSLGTAFAPYFQNRRMGSLTPDDVATWFAQRAEDAAQDTKHRFSKNARAFLRWARDRGYTDEDLVQAIEPIRGGGPRTTWLSWQEVHTILQHIPEWRLQMAAAWLFYTGARVGEAVAARQRDVRRPNAEWMYQWTIPQTKTDAPRHVWLPDALAAYLERSRAENKPKPDWPVLWDCSGRGFARDEHPAYPLSPKTINAALERARDAAGITTPVTAHVARHTYCTLWISDHGESETSMIKLSRQVGTSVGKLRSTYVHVQYSDNDWAMLREFGQRTA
jgi:integrase